MKAEIRKEIYCSYDNMKKYLPPQYIDLVNKNFYGKVINIVCFPIGTTIASGNIKKVLKKINNSDTVTLYFARCFTLDAIEMIRENNGEACAGIEFPWTDERYNRIRSGTR
ncbi:MAG TPA: hypothetical protein RWO09_07605 [Ruminococcus sp.]